MKKSKFLALALVVAIMLMGAGYAAWTDKYTIDTTINTGKLEVVLLDNNNSPQSWAEVYQASTDAYRDATPSVEGAAGDYFEMLNPVVDQDTKTATFGFSNLYPGMKVHTYVIAKNTGTIPAVIDTVDVTFDPKEAEEGKVWLPEVIDVTYRFVVRDGQGNRVGAPIQNTCKLDQLATTLNADLNGVTLLPEYELTDDAAHRLRNTLTFEIAHDALEGDQGEDDTLNVKIDFNFVQQNMYVAPAI